jgi:hypothetical protein
MDGVAMRDEKEKEKQDPLPPPAVVEGQETGQDMDW